MKKILSVAAVALVCGLSVAQPRPERSAQPYGNGQRTMTEGRSPSANSGQAVRQGSGRRTSDKMRRGTTSERDSSESDQKLLQSIEEADSLSELMQLSRQVQASKSTEVRQAMVDALDGQGKDAANLLAAYLGDSDEEVANSAFIAWSSKLQDMKSARRVQAITAAAQALQQGGQSQAGGQTYEQGGRFGESAYGQGGRSQNGGPSYGQGGQFQNGGPSYGQGGQFQNGGPSYGQGQPYGGRQFQQPRN